eukprot:COSAG04_NODE_19602_length_412_cov_1.137380_1_plen_123_part_01
MRLLCSEQRLVLGAERSWLLSFLGCRRWRPCQAARALTLASSYTVLTAMVARTEPSTRPLGSGSSSAQPDRRETPTRRVRALSYSRFCSVAGTENKTLLTLSRQVLRSSSRGYVSSRATTTSI